MQFLDVDRRQALVQIKNRKGQTPLDLAAAFRGTGGNDGAGRGAQPIVQVQDLPDTIPLQDDTFSLVGILPGCVQQDT